MSEDKELLQTGEKSEVGMNHLKEPESTEFNIEDNHIDIAAENPSRETESKILDFPVIDESESDMPEEVDLLEGISPLEEIDLADETDSTEETGGERIGLAELEALIEEEKKLLETPIRQKREHREKKDKARVLPKLSQSKVKEEKIKKPKEPKEPKGLEFVSPKLKKEFRQKKFNIDNSLAVYIASAVVAVLLLVAGIFLLKLNVPVFLVIFLLSGAIGFLMEPSITPLLFVGPVIELLAGFIFKGIWYAVLGIAAYGLIVLVLKWKKKA